jgi:hypothetical protein
MSGITHSSNQNSLQTNKIEGKNFSANRALKQVIQYQNEDVTTNKILTENDPLPPSDRLIVIIPDSGFDIPSIQKRIWKLAAPDHRSVLLINKPCRVETEYRSQRNLTSLAATIRDWRVLVRSQVVLGKSLVQAVEQYKKPGDVIVCFREHSIPGLFKKTQLAESLAAKTNLPVYTLAGKVTDKNGYLSSRLLDILFWVVSLVMLIGFFAFGVWIDQNSTGIFRTIIQVMAIIFEVGILTACAKKLM